MSAAPPAPTVPTGWEAIYDANYSRYYFHSDSTGESVWEVPSEPSLPATNNNNNQRNNQDNDRGNDQGYDRGRGTGTGNGEGGHHPRERSRSRERGGYQQQNNNQGYRQNDGYQQGGYQQGNQGYQQGGYQQGGYQQGGYQQGGGRGDPRGQYNNNNNNYNNNNYHNNNNNNNGGNGGGNFHRQQYQSNNNGYQQSQTDKHVEREPDWQGERRDGDWDCPQCNGHNYSNKTHCFKCRLPRPAEFGRGNPNGRGGGPPPAPRRENNNRADNNRDANGYSTVKAAIVPLRPGDWNCGACKSHNFARNNSCFRCRGPVHDGQRVGNDGTVGTGYEPPSKANNYHKDFDINNIKKNNTTTNNSNNNNTDQQNGKHDCSVCRLSFQELRPWLTHVKNKGDRAHTSWRSKNQKKLIEAEQELNGDGPVLSDLRAKIEAAKSSILSNNSSSSSINGDSSSNNSNNTNNTNNTNSNSSSSSSSSSNDDSTISSSSISSNSSSNNGNETKESSISDDKNEQAEGAAEGVVEKVKVDKLINEEE